MSIINKYTYKMFSGLFKAIIGSNKDEDLLNELDESLEQQKSARKEAKV